MRTFLLVVAYDGTNYNGFQRATATPRDETVSAQQPKRPRTGTEEAVGGGGKKKRPGTPAAAASHVITVQDRIEVALVRLTGATVSELRVRGAGRTDSGVHAEGQVVAFDLPDGLERPRGTGQERKGGAQPELFSDLDVRGGGSGEGADGDLWRIRRGINSRLPHDISVRSARILPPPPPGGRPFEPRHDVATKRYTYRLRFRKKRYGVDGNTLAICCSGPNTIRRARDPTDIWICPWSLDEGLIRQACQALAGRHDFSCFVAKVVRREKDNRIDLRRFDVTLRNDFDEENCDHGTSGAIPCDAMFTLEACGFRRRMVRLLIGFVVDIARGVQCLDDVPKALDGTDASAKLVKQAPACGLCLTKVFHKSGSAL